MNCRRRMSERKQIEGKLAREGFEAAGEFAAYAAQDTNLHLKPWQTPPCWISIQNIEAELAAPGDDTHGRKRAAELLQRLLAAGLSKFEPNPIGALERVEREGAA